MWVLLTLISVALIFVFLLDGFETMVLPRRVTRPFRVTRLFYHYAWMGWRGIGLSFKPGKRREAFLSIFGPLSLLLLFVVWIVGLMAAFALLYWSLGTPLSTAPNGARFGTYFYLSSGTFLTLGVGDVTPLESVGRFLVVLEAGVGFGFIAVIIGYLPVLYQAFSRREVTISLLDARAGSPPSAGQFLRRLALAKNLQAADAFLAEWERWAGELLESHLSFPFLSFYRSQHDNQSWLAALTAILDTCALLLTNVKGAPRFQAQMTFAMARHAAVDLGLVFRTPPVIPDPDRLPAERLAQLRAMLREAGLDLRDGPGVEAPLTQLRGMYEPFVNALAERFLLVLPPVLTDHTTVDNWQTSAWMRRTVGIGRLPGVAGDDHFG
jgi:hypothetical protein